MSTYSIFSDKSETEGFPPLVDLTQNDP